MIKQISIIETEHSIKEIEYLLDIVVIIIDKLTKEIYEVEKTFNCVHNVILRQEILHDFREFIDFTANLDMANSSLDKLVITGREKNNFKIFNDKYHIYFDNQSIHILKTIEIKINELEDCIALISTLELLEQAKKIDDQICIDWFKNLSISFNYLLEVLEKDIFLERYKRSIEIIETNIKSIISIKNLRHLYKIVEEYRQEEFKQYLSSTISLGKAILYEIDEKLLKFKNFDEEYTLLQVKEGEESFNSLEEFFNYLDESYIESLK